MTICDLRSEPILPVLTSGEDTAPSRVVVSVGLRELMVNAHTYTDLAITISPAAAGMLRVLYVIAARVTGIDKARTRVQFETLRADAAERGRFSPERIDAYLYRSDLDGRWNLFDPVSPWLQDPRLVKESKPKSINTFDPTRPRDNGPIWWRHTWTERVPALSAAEALQWLLTHYWYGSGGTGGTRRVGDINSQHMSAGPLRGTVSFYPLGRNLFQTIIAGIPSPSTAPGAGIDFAPWEAQECPDPLSAPDEATWPAGLLTGQSRHAMLLVPDSSGTSVHSCYLTWAYKTRHPPLADPYTIQDRRNDVWQPRLADAARAVWRDVDALLADQVDRHRPQVWTDTQSMPDSWQADLRVRVYGWEQDRKSTDRMMFTATTPQLLQWAYENDPEAAVGAAGLHAAAEDMHGVMCTALRTAYRNLGGGSSRKPARDAPWIALADALYWPAAEKLFWELLPQRGFDRSYRSFLPLAIDAVDAATRHVAHHPQVARETANAVRHLRRFAAKKNPPKEGRD
ncbi:type I-E CRISPR-associated protein Cse1/CasA [Nocardia sp. NPDC050406]|uniref:type I-E CRISPR-associated protein Cse1/CasA n=1 Tax=Nocardia sp. NPDC050406 TaxID=3364318 RepID=UPI0037B69DC6